MKGSKRPKAAIRVKDLNVSIQFRLDIRNLNSKRDASLSLSHISHSIRKAYALLHIEVYLWFFILKAVEYSA